MRRDLYLLLRRAWWRLNGYPAHQIAALLCEAQWWPREKLEALRDEKLAQLIEHSYCHVPYYQRVMDDRGLKPNDIRSAADLKKLPVLTKDLVRACWNQLRADNIPDTAVFVATTGGSTGEPMRIVKSYKSDAWANMCFERGISWGGLEEGTTYVTLTGGSLGGSRSNCFQKLRERVSGTINLLAYDLQEKNVAEYASIIRRSRTQFIIGYASNVYHLAVLLRERGERLPLQAVFTTAEQLLPSWEKVIRESMGCKVYSFYGCGECNSLGYQCSEGEAYHIPEEHVVLEIESASGKSQSGSALITDLDNYAMPLLRYQNGDYLTLDNKRCGCGRCLNLIAKLEGRTYEFFFSASGGLVSAGICDFILGNVEGINEFQVRQDAPDHIRILAVARRTLSSDEGAYICDSFRHYLGETFGVEIQLVDKIPRTIAQKLQTAINELL